MTTAGSASPGVTAARPRSTLAIHWIRRLHRVHPRHLPGSQSYLDACVVADFVPVGGGQLVVVEVLRRAPISPARIDRLSNLTDYSRPILFPTLRRRRIEGEPVVSMGVPGVQMEFHIDGRTEKLLSKGDSFITEDIGCPDFDIGRRQVLEVPISTWRRIGGYSIGAKLFPEKSMPASVVIVVSPCR